MDADINEGDHESWAAPRLSGNETLWLDSSIPQTQVGQELDEQFELLGNQGFSTPFDNHNFASAQHYDKSIALLQNNAVDNLLPAPNGTDEFLGDLSSMMDLDFTDFLHSVANGLDFSLFNVDDGIQPLPLTGTIEDDDTTFRNDRESVIHLDSPAATSEGMMDLNQKTSSFTQPSAPQSALSVTCASQKVSSEPRDFSLPLLPRLPNPSTQQSGQHFGPLSKSSWQIRVAGQKNSQHDARLYGPKAEKRRRKVPTGAKGVPSSYCFNFSLQPDAVSRGKRAERSKRSCMNCKLQKIKVTILIIFV